MRYRGTICLLALIGGVAACAPARPGWHKAGASEAEVTADWNACRRQGNDAVGYDRGDDMDASNRPDTNPLALYDQEKREELYRRVVRNCMRAKGYAAGR